MHLDVDRYEDYTRVLSPDELFGDGRRIYTSRRTKPLPEAPPASIILGAPRFDWRDRCASGRLSLRMVKIPSALLWRNKIIIDSDRNRVLLESFRKLRPSPVDIDLDALRSDARFVAGYSFYAAASHNGFGHVLLEAFSNYWGFDLVRDKIKRVVVNRNAAHYKSMYAAVGVTEKAAVWVRKYPLLCENLIVPSQSYVLDATASPEYFDIMRRVRQRVVGVSSDKKIRLYVSRRSAGKRRLLNEAGVEAVFADHGFRIFQPERHAIEEQIRIFAAASHIAGPVGSALYNAVFSDPHTQRIILAPDWFATRNDLLLSPGLRAAPFYVFGTSIGASSPSEGLFADWTVDIEGLRAALPAILGGPPTRRGLAGFRRVRAPDLLIRAARRLVRSA